MRRAMKFGRPFAVLGVLCALSQALLADPGFGSIKKRRITLQIRQPALVRLANTTVAFRADSSNPQYAPVVNSLATQLFVELVGNEKTLIQKNNPAEAAWVLGLRVTGYSVANPQSRTQMVGNSATMLTRWSGSLTVAYQVVDHNGRVHDASNVSYQYDREFDSNTNNKTVGGISMPKLPIPGLNKKNTEPVPHTPDDVRQILVNEVVSRIASKLGNTSQNVDVQVAGGDDRMNRAADFMEKKLWARALEELDKAPAYGRPEQESYRQYDLGLVYEGMAYEAKTANDQKENLYKAQEYYDKALEMNAREKYFVETIARSKESVARYKTLNQMQQRDEQVKQTPPPAPPPPVIAQAKSLPPNAPTVRPASGQAPPVRNVATTPPPVASRPAAGAPKPPQKKSIAIGDVIEMFNAGVPQDQIVGVIEASPVAFDPLDKDTVVAIARAKLPLALQNAMRKRIGAPLLGPTPTPNGAKK